MADETNVLVVDDDAAVAEVLALMLQREGHRATRAPDAESALFAIDKAAFDLVITDVRMPGMSGLELLKALKVRAPEVPVVLITAHEDVRVAVDAMRHGAADFLIKPLSLDQVAYVVAKELGASRAERAAPPAESEASEQMLGEARAVREVKELLRKVAGSNLRVLLLGEPGTGKELGARAIHAHSRRRAGPFVAVNCATLPKEELFISEVFGHEKGAFTGAVARKLGRAELANGGTLFLDEVGELPLEAQQKLLRFLQEAELERLGGSETIAVDVRVVGATNRPLAKMVQEGTFRADLYDRLNGISITLPPLRERREDIPLLANHFLDTLGPANDRPSAALAESALALLSTQSWPGNVRELKNFIERLLVLSPRPESITELDVKREVDRYGAQSIATAFPVPRAPVERTELEQALLRSNGNRSQAARLLGVSRRTLYNRIEACGLQHLLREAPGAKRTGAP